MEHPLGPPLPSCDVRLRMTLHVAGPVGSGRACCRILLKRDLAFPHSPAGLHAVRIDELALRVHECGWDIDNCRYEVYLGSPSQFAATQLNLRKADDTSWMDLFDNWDWLSAHGAHDLSQLHPEAAVAMIDGRYCVINPADYAFLQYRNVPFTLIRDFDGKLVADVTDTPS